MKKVLFITILIFYTLEASSVLLVKKGWQLIGSSTPINMSEFKSKNVEQVWHFNANTQRWQGYSPNRNIMIKMKENNISKLISLQPWHGFWIKSKRDWALTFKDRELKTAPENENISKDKIILKKGWNLISLPIDSVVSPYIFKGLTVWKYNGEWRLFDKNNQTDKEFPPINSIKNSDGLWIKADKDLNISIMKEASKLHNFKTKEDMDRYIKEMALLNNYPYWGIMPLYFEGARDENTLDSAMPTASTSEESSAIKNSTDTNIQEIGVDEADILKHNNQNIFYVVNSSQNSSILITSFEKLTKNSKEPINRLDFNNQQIEGIYLIDNRLVVLLTEYQEAILKNKEVTTIPSPKEYSPKVLVKIFDISNINTITPISNYKIDGTIINSRVIDNNLYLISNFSPKVNITYPKVYIKPSDKCKEYFERERYNDDYIEAQPTTTTDTITQKNEYPIYAECYNIIEEYNTGKYYYYDYNNPTVKIEQLTPKIQKDSLAKEELLKPSRLYAPSKENQEPIISTITNISISNGEYKSSNSFVGYSYTQYASSNALYLISNNYPIYYNFNNYKERSVIYKFNLNNSLAYRGKGEVYGYPLNQFSLSEYKNILRIATTEGFSWGDSGTNNSIYTLKDENGKLNIQGVLSGLGKEGETIKSVKFIGDKGFVVTFKQTDPLYTIDISNPQLPQKVGELEINGYSSYLHPVGEDKLLGIGRDADNDGNTLGLKIELFDISDFSNPTLLDSIKYNKNTNSELEYNHKALAYRNSDNLFAFPYRFYGDYIDEYKTSNYLGVYQIKDNKIISYQPISEPNSNDWGQHRGVIFDINNKTFISLFGNSDNTITEELNKTVVK